MKKGKIIKTECFVGRDSKNKVVSIKCFKNNKELSKKASKEMATEMGMLE